MIRHLFILAAASAALAAAPALSATLTHAYEFNVNGASTAFDSVGGQHGTLFGGASVNNGKLLLDGNDDYVEFNAKLIPASVFSLYIRYADHQPQLGNFVEIISQGQSGSGFYIGASTTGLLRVSDAATAIPGVLLPADGSLTELFLQVGSISSGVGVGTMFINGSPVYSGNVQLGQTGGNTRLGRQFPQFNEFFQGSIDTVRIFDGVATLQEARSFDAPAVPEPASWAMLIAGFGLTGAALRRRRLAPQAARTGA